MTKKKIDARREVVVHGFADLQLGDRVAFKATLGNSMRMNTSFTYGGHDSAGYLLSDDGKRTVTISTFLKNIAGWDNTEWHVWRKITKTPTEVGTVIYVEKLTSSNVDKSGMAGLAVLRGSGSWEFVRHPEVKFGASNIEKWYHINVDFIDPKNN